MNTFQGMTRKEIAMLQNRMSYIEQLVEKVSQAVEKVATIYPVKAKSEDHNAPLYASKKTDDPWPKVINYVKVLFDIIIGKKI